MTRIGPAGWSYKDWAGIVYPAKPPKGFDPAAYLAQFFDTIEINSSFYGPPAASTVRGWVERVSINPNFRFTAKLWRGFRHERNATQQDEAAVKEGLDLFTASGRLGALLLQFPWSFKFTPENREYLAGLHQGSVNTRSCSRSGTRVGTTRAHWTCLLNCVWASAISTSR